MKNAFRKFWNLPWKAKGPILGVVAIIIIAAAASGGAEEEPNTAADADDETPTLSAGETPEATSEPENTNTPEPTATPEPPTPEPTPTVDTTPRIGSVFEKDGSKYTVNAVNESYVSGNQFLQPDAGNRFYAVDITQEGTKDGDPANPFYFSVQDAKGFVYSTPGFADIQPSFASGELAVGQVTRGWAVWEVPADAVIVTVLAQTSPLGGRSVIADLRAQ